MVAHRGGQAIVLALILLAAAAWYAPAVDGPFVYDDVRVVTQATSVDLSPAAVVRWVPGRALTILTYAMNARWHGFDARGYHAVNVALHLANGVLVFAVAAQLVAPTAALAAAAVFLWHPLNSQAVNYVSARSDLLLTLWVLLATWSVLRAGRRPWLWALAILAMAAAGASKEIGLVIVPLASVTLLAWRRQVPAVPYAVAAVWILLGATVGAHWTRIEAWFAMTARNGGSSLDPLTHAVGQASALWWLLSTIPWPAGFSIDHDFAMLSVSWQVSGVMLTGFALIAILLAWETWPVLAWSLAWVLVAVGPRFVMGTQDLLTESQLYLAMVGASVLTGQGVVALLRRRGPDPSLTLSSVGFWRELRQQWRVQSLHGGIA